MTDYPDTGNHSIDHQPIDIARLWKGGAVVAVVAALIAVLGIVFARGVVGVEILAPRRDGLWDDANTATYAALAALAALVATALMHLLLVATPRATQFFGWIMVLVTLIGVVVPLTLVAGTGPRTATALLNLVIGLVITGLVTSVARPAHLPATRSDQYWPGSTG